MNFVGAEVRTLDGEDIGNITKVDDEYFSTWKKGVFTDEEYRIPLEAILHVEPVNDKTPIVLLALSEEQVKHGYEFLKEKPNSEIVSGRVQSELRLPSGKPVIHYEAKPIEDNAAASKPKPLSGVGQYRCDMCAEKFDEADTLQLHRGRVHKAPTGI